MQRAVTMALCARHKTTRHNTHIHRVKKIKHLGHTWKIAHITGHRSTLTTMPLRKRTRLKSEIETFKDPIHFSIRFCVEGSFLYRSFFFVVLFLCSRMRKHHSSMYKNSIDNYPSCMDMSLDHGLCIHTSVNAIEMTIFFSANIFVGNLTRQWKWQSIFLFSKTNQIERSAAETFEHFFARKERQKIYPIKLFRALI